MNTIINADILTALAAREDFGAVVMILRQGEGLSKNDAKWQAWLLGPAKGEAIIRQWMHDSSTDHESLKRPDLKPYPFWAFEIWFNDGGQLLTEMQAQTQLEAEELVRMKYEAKGINRISSHGEV